MRDRLGRTRSAEKRNREHIRCTRRARRLGRCLGRRLELRDELGLVQCTLVERFAQFDNGQTAERAAERIDLGREDVVLLA